jgi:hypothetical protein
MTTKQHPFSIWFMIGLQLDIYGLMILGAGIYNYFLPPAAPVVMNHLHAAIWWGALLVLMGVFYTIRFFPKKNGG